MMDDRQARRIAERHLGPGESIAWLGRSMTRGYAMRYVPGNLLALVFAALFVRIWFVDRKGPSSAFAWIFLCLILLAIVRGLHGILLETDVYWAVTDRGLLRIRRDRVRRYPAEHLDDPKLSGDSVAISLVDNARHDDEPSQVEMRALAVPQAAHAAVRAMIAGRTIASHDG